MGAEKTAAEIAAVRKEEEKLGDASEGASRQMSARNKAIAEGRVQGNLWQDSSNRWRIANGQFATSADKAAEGIANVGRESDKSSRRVDGLEARLRKFFGGGKGGGGGGGRTSTLNLPGPLSIPGLPVPIAIAAFGAAANAIPPVTSAVLGLAEAAGTAAGGAGAAGGVGLLALGQAMGTVTLASHGLKDALGGNLDAYMRLSPAQQRFVGQLQSMEPLLTRLQNTAARGLLPGAGAGLQAASRNFPVLRGIVGGTAGALGGIARQAGEQAGSAAFGRDLGTLGRTNVRIIRDLGDAGLSLADAARHILVEAAPLAEWLARQAREGARLIDVWAGNARAGGDLRRFFQGAREDLSLLWSIFQHTAGGIVNIFGSQDVNGTRTLRTIDRVTARFERWTRSKAVRQNFGEALLQGIENAIPKIIDALAKGLARGAPTAAGIFWKAFWGTDMWGKAGIALALGLKGGGGIGGLLGSLGKGVGGALGLGGQTGSLSKPFYVIDIGHTKEGKSLLDKARDLAKKAAPVAAVGARAFAIPAAGAAAVVAGAEVTDRVVVPKHRERSANRSSRDPLRNPGGDTDVFNAAKTAAGAVGHLIHGIFGGGDDDKPRRPRARAHLDSVLREEPPRRLRGRPPDIVVHSHVHTNDREIGKATGRHTWREDDRR